MVLGSAHLSWLCGIQCHITLESTPWDLIRGVRTGIASCWHYPCWLPSPLPSSSMPVPQTNRSKTKPAIRLSNRSTCPSRVQLLLDWQPGDELPDFISLSAALRSMPLPAQRMDYVFATQRAANLTGGFGGRGPRTSEISHDLSLARVYLQMREHQPERAQHWVSEAAIADQVLTRSRNRRTGQKLPDAMLIERRQKTAIEYGGTSYSAQKLQAFHVFCDEQGWAYELWGPG